VHAPRQPLVIRFDTYQDGSFSKVASEIASGLKVDPLKHNIVAVLPYNAQTHVYVQNTHAQKLYEGCNVIIFRANGERLAAHINRENISDIARALNLAYLPKDNAAITRAVNLEAGQMKTEGADEKFQPIANPSSAALSATWSRHITKARAAQAASVGRGAALAAPWARGFTFDYQLEDIRVNLGGSVFTLKTSPDELSDLGCKLGSLKHGKRIVLASRGPFPEVAKAAIA
jgi:hypothetical protein